MALSSNECNVLAQEEGRDAPWCDFVKAIVEAGMGQMESKTFLTQFPPSYPAKPLRGVRARFTVTWGEKLRG